MANLFEAQVFPDGTKLWYASAVPTLFSDNPAGFNLGDQILVTGSGNTAGRLYVCTTASVLTPGSTAAAVFKAASVSQVNTTQYTNFWTTGAPPISLTPGVAAAGENGLTDTAGVQYQTWLAAVYIDSDCTLTGISYLIGNTGTTDKVQVGLYDALGVLLASSAGGSSGAVVGTANTFQSVAFTAKVNVAGPALHFIAIQTNGTHATLQAIAVGVAPTGIVAAGSALAVPATITPPTTFTTNEGICASTY